MGSPRISDPERFLSTPPPWPPPRPPKKHVKEAENVWYLFFMIVNIFTLPLAVGKSSDFPGGCRRCSGDLHQWKVATVSKIVVPPSLCSSSHSLIHSPVFEWIPANFGVWKATPGEGAPMTRSTTGTRFPEFPHKCPSKPGRIAHAFPHSRFSLVSHAIFFINIQNFFFFFLKGISFREKVLITFLARTEDKQTGNECPQPRVITPINYQLITVLIKD